MFGKSCTRLITYAMMGAIALTMGSQLISSAAGIVIAWRVGNPMPLIMVVVLTVIVLRLSVSFKSVSVLSKILEVLGWASVAYLAFTVLLVTIPLGLVTALMFSALVSVGCAFVRSPSSMLNLASTGLSGSITSAALRSGIIRGVLREGDTVWDSVQDLPLEVFTVQQKDKDTIVEILRDRPLLPTSLTHLEDIDVLVVNTSDDNKWVSRVEQLLQEAGVATNRAPEALRQTVLALPLIERGHDIELKDYRIVTSEETVERLLKLWPLRMTVHPSTSGLRLVVLEQSASGFDLQEIPRGLEAQVVVARDLRLIENIGVDDTGNTT